jgi:hypothetical protein
MNTTKNTKPIIIATAIAVAVGLGLGGCADQPNAAEARALRVASEIAHEVERAEHRVQAAHAPEAAQGSYRDQAERRSEVTTPLNRTFDQVERRLLLGH